MFVRDTSDAADLRDARRSAAFPLTEAGLPDRERRLSMTPGTLGYPDVDTYRDLYFILEGTPLAE